MRTVAHYQQAIRPPHPRLRLQRGQVALLECWRHIWSMVAQCQLSLSCWRTIKYALLWGSHVHDPRGVDLVRVPLSPPTLSDRKRGRHLHRSCGVCACTVQRCSCRQVMEGDDPKAITSSFQGMLLAWRFAAIRFGAVTKKLSCIAPSADRSRQTADQGKHSPLLFRVGWVGVALRPRSPYL
jgi:hypothetical protein